MEKVKTENIKNIHIVSNDLEFELTGSNHKHMVQKHIFVFHSNDCSIAPLTDYTKDSMFQELQKESEYFSSNEERLYIDLRDSKDYTDEFKKIRRDDNNRVLSINPKKAAAKENEMKNLLTLYG